MFLGKFVAYGFGLRNESFPGHTVATGGADRNFFVTIKVDNGQATLGFQHVLDVR
jgi:hypothetical protein